MPDTLSTSQSTLSSSTTEPTVLVKKADGSMVRVPMSRLKGKLPEKKSESSLVEEEVEEETNVEKETKPLSIEPQPESIPQEQLSTSPVRGQGEVKQLADEGKGEAASKTAQEFAGRLAKEQTIRALAQGSASLAPKEKEKLSARLSLDDLRLRRPKEGSPDHIKKALADARNFGMNPSNRSGRMQKAVDEKTEVNKAENKEKQMPAREEPSFSLSSTASAPQETALSATTPNTHIFEEIARARNTWSGRDHESLLTDAIEPHEADASETPTPDDRKGPSEKVIAALSFRVPDALQKRLASLIGSRMKEIRSDMQLKEYAMRSETEGGLALTEAQARELLDATRKALNLLPLGAVPRSKATADVAAKIRDRQIKASAQSSATEKTPPVFSDAPSPNQIAPERSPFLNPSFGPKPILHDVIPPPAPIGTNALDRLEAADTVGPVDEIRRMTLLDFRRLNRDTAAARALFAQKFAQLKEESFILYLQSIDAWHESPLYTDYLGIIEQTIESRESLDAILARQEKNGLTPAEFSAIAEISRVVSL